MRTVLSRFKWINSLGQPFWNVISKMNGTPEGAAAAEAAGVARAAGAGAGAAVADSANAGWNVNFDPAGNQIQQGLDREKAELNLALACCGICHNDACEHLMDGQGITSMMSLAWMTDKHTKKIIKYHNSGLTTVAMMPI